MPLVISLFSRYVYDDIDFHQLHLKNTVLWVRNKRLTKRMNLVRLRGVKAPLFYERKS